MAKKIWIEGRLGYNHNNDRYGLLVSDLWEDDEHGLIDRKAREELLKDV